MIEVSAASALEAAARYRACELARESGVVQVGTMVRVDT